MTKLQQDRKRHGLCVLCGGKPKPDCLRCEPCLKKQRQYDKAQRQAFSNERGKGAKTVEPQCKLPDGKMRAEHVFDEDGLCDCSARRMEFAPRPPLRPEMVRASKPAARRSAAAVVAPAKTQAPAPPVRRVVAAPMNTRPTPAGNGNLKAAIAELERRRRAIDDEARELDNAIAVLGRLANERP
jgi:hypothetical protein